jgi:hypothetical protein
MGEMRDRMLRGELYRPDDPERAATIIGAGSVVKRSADLRALARGEVSEQAGQPLRGRPDAACPDTPPVD